MDITKRWQSVDQGRGYAGDDRFRGWRGNDVWEPDEGEDRARLGAGSDYVWIWPDGDRDVIQCGRGRDLVEYYGAIEQVDELTGCEHVPSVSDGKNNARAHMRAAR